MSTRRDFLKHAMLLSGAAGFANGVPKSVLRAFAIDPEVGTSWRDAEHIVILMQENRSFDHALGSLQGVRGFNDPRAIRLPNGNPVFLQTNASGKTYAPWRLDMKDTRATWMGSIPHSRDSQIDAWNGGNYNNWIDAKRPHNEEYAAVPLTMGHYTREDLPFYYALADAFTVCDQNYCGVMSSTTPNRLTFMAGTVRDRQSTHSKVYMRNSETDNCGLKFETFPERLQKAGISWKYYQNDLSYAGGMTGEERKWLGNFGTNVLEYFDNYHIWFNPRYQPKMRGRIAALSASIKRTQAKLEALDDDSRAARELRRTLKVQMERMHRFKTYYKRSQGSLSELPAEAQDLHQRAFVTNDHDPDFHSLTAIDFQDGTTERKMDVPKGDVLRNFREDLHSGKLPTISWLSPADHFSDHPTSPWYGAWYVSEVMDILTSNPEVWKKTIFILTYDENDGYFDHAPSYVAADPRKKMTGGASSGIDTGLEYSYAADELVHGVSEDEARSGPIGLGFRVPMIIASPWSRGGWVNSQLFEHSSTLQFLERFVEGKYKKQVRETNISPWRRAISGDLTSVFRQYDGKCPPLPFLNRDRYVESIQRARYKEIPSNYKALNQDEIVRAGRDVRGSGMIPKQEPGVRQACALPYEPYADGHVSKDGKSFEIEMRAGNRLFADRSAGFPFNVYLYGTNESTASTATAQSQPNMISATYAVRSGSALKESFDLSLFPGGKYEIAIHGPNGFFRQFTGTGKDPAIGVACSYKDGSIELSASNGEKAATTAQVVDNSYDGKPMAKTIAPGKLDTIILNLERQHGWYDFSVKVDGADGFEKRFAGHVETGNPSYTDPLMGEV